MKRQIRLNTMRVNTELNSNGVEHTLDCPLIMFYKNKF